MRLIFINETTDTMALQVDLGPTPNHSFFILKMVF